MAQPLPIPTSLPSPPTDGVTSLSYLSTSSLLASSSWDGAIRIHDTAAKTAVVKKALERPLLSLAAQKDSAASVYCGGIDGSIHKLDVEKDSIDEIGLHSNPDTTGEKKLACSCLSFADESSTLLASAGWDGKFALWDVRWNKKVAEIDLPGKAFDMDISHQNKMAVVATAGRRNCFIDLRSVNKLLEDEENRKEDDTVKILLDRDSSLKYQTRCVRFFPNGSGMAVGSIEGRVAIEYLDDVGIASGENVVDLLFQKQSF
jgi:WD40 repeat protein